MAEEEEEFAVIGFGEVERLEGGIVFIAQAPYTSAGGVHIAVVVAPMVDGEVVPVGDVDGAIGSEFDIDGAEPSV